MRVLQVQLLLKKHREEQKSQQKSMRNSPEKTRSGSTTMMAESESAGSEKTGRTARLFNPISVVTLASVLLYRI